MSRWQGRLTATLWLLAAAVAAVAVHVWLDVLPAQEGDEETIVAAADGTAEIAGQTITVERSAWDAVPAPAGSRTLSVGLYATGGAAATGCGPLRLVEAGSGRVWLDARSELDVPFDAGERSCLAEESAPYTILPVFLLPEDAAGPFTLEIPDEADRIGRFPVSP